MSKSRHVMVDSACEVCGNTYQVRRIKVVAGTARFCSKNCFHIHQRDVASQTIWGKEKGKAYWDSTKEIWMIHYYDDGGVVHVTTYSRWWWELNVGDVPVGHKVSYKDGDKSNINPSNFFLRTDLEVSENARRLKESHSVSKETRIKMQQQKRNFTGEPTRKDYALEFSKKIKDIIRARDKYRCRVCFRPAVGLNSRVHHIDANKHNTDEQNLILVCKSCHGKIHSMSKTDDPVILAFRSRLYT